MPLADSHHRRFALALALALALVALETVAIIGGLGAAGREEPVAKSPMAAPITLPTVSAPTSTAKDVGRPQRLTIRSIDVDAPITEVGTTAAGAQDVPRSIEATGWWRDGVQPGLPGNAVIVGHTARGADGVFDKLSKLDRGDAISVRSKFGTLRYLVTREQSVKVADFGPISPLVYRTGGQPGLVLMTCGDWNGERYTATTIVFAVLAAH